MSLNFAFAGLKDQVTQYSNDKNVLVNEIDTAGTNIVNLVRGIAGVAGVVMIIWAGIVFGGAHGDPNKIMLAKKMLGCFVICIVLVFSAEKIVGGIFGVLGYSPAGTAGSTR